MRTPSIFFHISGLTILIILTGSLYLSGSTACAEETEKFQEYEVSIDKVRQGIKIHLGKLQVASAREVRLLDKLEKIDKKLSNQKLKLSNLQQRLQVQKVVLTGKEEELLFAMERKNTVSAQLESRLRAYYLMGEVGFLNVIFSNKNLPDLIIFNDSYKKLLEHDQSIIKKYREAIRQFDGVALARETEKAILETFIGQNREEQIRLDIIRKDQQKLLTRIRSQKGLYEQAVREMQRSEADLTSSLVSFKKKHKNKERGFLINKGRLPGPVKGRLIIGFDEQVEGRTSKGITIAAKEGAEVFSIFAGRVIFTGYKTGFGNMIIIDHGLQHYTITARLDTIMVKEGQQVSSEQKIGTTGGIATLFSQGLYFEIRRESKNLDPLNWLRAGIYEIN